MAYTDRAKSIIDAIIDGNSNGPQQQRVAAAAIKYRPDLLELYAADPENPTNEEKAQVFVEAVKSWGKSWLRATAEKDARSGNDATVAAAGDTAAGDL